MFDLRFDNRFVRELPADRETSRASRQVSDALYARVSPTPVAAPRLVAYADDVAARIGFTAEDLASQRFADVFAGNATLEGMEPFAAVYGGHQFGSWAGQLGDGRAISLGEVVNAQGERWELQLKGAGPTAFSRRSDGRAVMRSSIREFLCSESMHHLGVPTTRALCLVATGDFVERDMFYDGHPKLEAGAIVCRTAPSFLRFGNFELPTARGDVTLLKQLVNFTIARDFQLEGPEEERYVRFFHEVCARTARMVAHWMRVGFVHGVMNTDNMSVLGVTIDYGPYGFLDSFDPNWTPNTTDAQRKRYRFGAQPEIAHWNLARFAEALVPLFPTLEPLEAGLEVYAETFSNEFRGMMAKKFGFASALQGDDDDVIRDGLRLLAEAEIDMTLFFRNLAKVDANAPSLAPLEEAFYRPDLRARHDEALNAWLGRWATLARAHAGDAEARAARMNAVNPRFLLRNYLAQEAIDAAEAGDESKIHALLRALREPYAESPAHEGLLDKRPEWARKKAGCSMLSCSS